ncbi:hypothetical protein NPX13_g6361 [Xylaria arbuscula]|uniref:Major facilitator superfamily (MFS) profile domain-containing protein n=1 Tax=Xylaria arbuscula TaxID=114810 RepID=A0A9W8TK70_9PEZI|nr:hypothetical protein NPX13_g6361 [Xylaria arbuscula]
MAHPEKNDSQVPEQGRRDDDDIGMKSAAAQDTMSEKHDAEKDVEDGRHPRSAHIDAAVAARIADNVDDFMTLVNEADEANERERGNLAYPAFKDRFGIVAPNGDHVIPASWQNGISGATNVGEIIGLQIAGVVSERWGYRWTIIGALVAVTGFIFFPFFAGNLTVFLVGELFQGMAWGCLPDHDYGFISSGILVGLESRTDVWGYKIPFAVQWVWPIPIAIGTYLAPESPWWCIRKEKRDRAEQSLKRLARSSGFSQREADAAMALMIYTDEMEKQVAAGTTYLDCFKGVNLRRTEIVCMTWLAQTLSGTALGGLSTFFYQQAGISDSDSFKLSWGKDAINFVGTVTSWFVLNKIGRKTLMFSGMSAIFVFLL